MIAHRGLSGLLPENTLPSLSAAMYAGSDFVEMDVVLTREKQPVVMHDPYLSRITDVARHP